ncbi:MAG: hypothetical protein LUH49_14500 [Cloacibacillus porcorum]|nr:hypothetical protein [Cloacibacillus porcorum]
MDFTNPTMAISKLDEDERAMYYIGRQMARLKRCVEKGVDISDTLSKR